jgi:FG-GAP-like repeat
VQRFSTDREASREAAQEYSPVRKPWGKEAKTSKAPKGRKTIVTKTFHSTKLPNRISPAKSLRVATTAIVLLVFLLHTAAFAANPIPQVVGPPNPQAVVPGSDQFTLTVYGANFVSGAVVNWNRSARSTTFISARELQAQILASDVAKPTAGYITVTNPPPGGGVSSSSFALVEVHTPTSTIVAKKPHAYLADNPPFFLVLTDFNNDGILDFAASYGSEIKVLLGNGDGTFGHSSVAAHNYLDPAAIVNGDFNNDGNEDLAFGANSFGPPSWFKVDLGDGNGKFTPGARFGHFSAYPLQIVAGDFNGDGNLDLIASDNGNYVFLGNGDGTFKQLVLYDLEGLAGAADFNGDGKLDLLVGTREGLAVRLGNGDGTFQKPRKIVSISKNFGCDFGPTVLVTDFNGDGKADLAYCETEYPLNRGKIWVMLGNGDGTFKKPTFLSVPAWSGAFSFAAGDFNSDGKTDLVANYLVSGYQSEFALFRGNGDGTFQHKKVVRIGEGPHEGDSGIVPADFNSDGLLDFIIQDPGQVVVVTQK